MKKETESGEDEIKPKLRRKPTELDSDDDEETVKVRRREEPIYTIQP